MTPDASHHDEGDTAPERALCDALEIAAGDAVLAVQAQRDEQGRLAVFRFFELADVVTDDAKQLSLSFARARIEDLPDDVKVGDEVGLELEPLSRLAALAQKRLLERAPDGEPLAPTARALDEALTTMATRDEGTLWRVLEMRGPALLNGIEGCVRGEPRNGCTLKVEIEALRFLPAPLVLAKAQIRATVSLEEEGIVLDTRGEEVALDADDEAFHREAFDDEVLQRAAAAVRDRLAQRLTELAGVRSDVPTPAEVFAGVPALRAFLEGAR